MDNEIKHYGMPRRSGRYPWGSGENPQRNISLDTTIKKLKKQKLSEAEIAEGLGMKSTELRERKSILKSEKILAERAQAMALREKGHSKSEIGRIMGKNESSIRMLLKPGVEERANSINNVATVLRENVDKKRYVDVGKGIEHQLGVSATKMRTAVRMLQDEGYKVYFFKTPQLGTQHNTSIKMLCSPDVDGKEAYKNRDKLGMIKEYSEDRGRTLLGLEPPRNISSDRIKIRYYEEGGADKDGVIELRRGVPELSLGTLNYAQVRIAVDGTHYMKGMAMYSPDDMPKGIDVIYNSNKHIDTPKTKVFKSMKEDPDNPFGSSIRQKHYIDADGKKQLSAINTVGLKPGSGEEGAWEKWSTTLSSQFLSKQTPELAKRQLGLSYALKKEEYDEIMALTNPVIKKRLLKSFADSCDSDAVHLKAAALYRTQSQVLLPIPSLKENEIYAPKFRNGESVVLIRHPHGGIFEIPELKVNNNDKTARKILPNPKDAVGINPKVAARLSGADFDGDTVLVIPNNQRLIRTKDPRTDPHIKSLLEFEPREQFRIPEGSNIKPMTEAEKGRKMGDVSNLITDMTIKGASTDKIVRAVKHSMVVIDAVNHNLDYKTSYEHFGIASLKKEFQGKERAGAATLISRAKSPKSLPYREEGLYVTDANGKKRRLYIDPKTGKKLYTEIGGTYKTPDGKVIKRRVEVSKMADTDDAHTLSSGTRIETVYGNHANRLKALANQARLDYLAAPKLNYSPSAKLTYADEVASLNSKLRIAEANKPFERKAQLLGDATVRMKRASNPGLRGKELDKVKAQALAEARTRVHAGKKLVDITPKEWEAIQAGAISDTKLTKIIDNANENQIKEYATPRTLKVLTPAKLAIAKARLEKGYTQAEVADSLGISISTLNRSIGD